jgi:hypothetical protein
MLIGAKRALLSSTSYRPVVFANFAAAGDVSTPSWINNSGTTGNRTYFDSTGKLTWAPANMLKYSQDFRNTATAGSARPWTWDGSTTVVSNVSGVSAPDGTETASRVSGFSTSDGDIGLSQSVTVSPLTVIGSIYVRGEGSNIGKKVLLRAKRIGGTLVINDAEITLTSGWQRLSVAHTMLSDNTGVQFILSGAAASNQASSCLAWGSQLEPVTYQTSPRAYIATTSAAVYQPRYDYDPSTVPATPRGLLIEEQRVNIVTASSAFTNAGPFWYQNDSPSATTTNLAPDGTATAYSWSFNTASTGYYAIPTLTGSITYAFSVYVKAISGAPVIRFGSDDTKFGGGANTLRAYVEFTPSTGVFSNVQSGVIAYDKQYVGNGWWRIWFTTTKNSTTEGTGIIAYVPSAGTGAVWGYQVEHAGTAGTPTSAPFITSLIPTTTASVTRDADIVQLTGNALTAMQGSAWSSAVEFSAIGFKTFARIGPDFDAFASAAYMQGDDYGRTFNGVSTLNVFIPGGGLFSSGANLRFGYTQSAVGRSAVINNGTLATDSARITGITVSYLGCNVVGGNQLNGHIRSMAIYNKRIPNYILSQKSIVGAPY